MENDLSPLIVKTKGGDQSAFALLLSKYDSLICAQVQSVREKGSGYGVEDLHQEAVIAFYDAIRNYDLSSEDVTFGLYAKICIRNRLLSVLRKERNGESQDMIPTVLPEEDVIDPSQSPEQAACDKDSFQFLLHRIFDTLTPFESAVFSLYIQNKSYREIASELSTPEKSVDNAIYRVKVKVKKLI